MIIAAYVKSEYSLMAYSTRCMFYDTSSGDFSSVGCIVGGCSSPLATQCLCTHLTSFSNSFHLPNTASKLQLIPSTSNSERLIKISNTVFYLQI